MEITKDGIFTMTNGNNMTISSPLSAIEGITVLPVRGLEYSGNNNLPIENGNGVQLPLRLENGKNTGEQPPLQLENGKRTITPEEALRAQKQFEDVAKRMIEARKQEVRRDYESIKDNVTPEIAQRYGTESNGNLGKAEKINIAEKIIRERKKVDSEYSQKDYINDLKSVLQ